MEVTRRLPVVLYLSVFSEKKNYSLQNYAGTSVARQSVVEKSISGAATWAIKCRKRAHTATIPSSGKMVVPQLTIEQPSPPAGSLLGIEQSADGDASAMCATNVDERLKTCCADASPRMPAFLYCRAPATTTATTAAVHQYKWRMWTVRTTSHGTRSPTRLWARRCPASSSHLYQSHSNDDRAHSISRGHSRFCVRSFALYHHWSPSREELRKESGSTLSLSDYSRNSSIDATAMCEPNNNNNAAVGSDKSAERICFNVH